MLLANGFEDAFLGEAMRYGFNGRVAAYDYGKCLDILMQDGMTYEEAEEFFSYNTLGAWVGEQTPVFIDKLSLAEVNALPSVLEPVMNDGHNDGKDGGQGDGAVPLTEIEVADATSDDE